MALVEAPDLFEDDLLYGEAGPGHGSLSGSESDDEAAAVPAQALSPHRKTHMDISVPNSASHQSSTLRVSLDEEHGIPTPSPPIDMAARPIYSRAMAASMPAQRVTVRMGTSAPINIPNMSRWRPGDRPGGAEAREAAATFIPPHQLSKQDDFLFSFTGASPAGGLKRERLRARNAILRSTGFIEPVGGSSAAAEGAEGDEGRPTPAPAPPVRPAVHSSLTAALTTIGEC